MAAGAAVVVALVVEAQVAAGKKESRGFLTKEEEQRLVTLIQNVERRTTGEIRVHLTERVSKHGPIADAQAAFHKLGMDKTKERNGVLIFIAHRDHQMSCIGDEGIHKFVGEDGWKHIIEILKSHFSREEHYVGLHKAIENVGETLASHFPAIHDEENKDELSNEISKS